MLFTFLFLACWLKLKSAHVMSFLACLNIVFFRENPFKCLSLGMDVSVDALKTDLSKRLPRLPRHQRLPRHLKRLPRHLKMTSKTLWDFRDFVRLPRLCETYETLWYFWGIWGKLNWVSQQVYIDMLRRSWHFQNV